ncbi:hypothetical protein ACLBWS_05885 [Brucellaceae bacterium D45D]
MRDHLSAEQIAFFQTATSLEAPVEERKNAVEQLLKNAIPTEARREFREVVRLIFNELCPDEAIEYRKDAA